jgi:hypothetical protein
MPGSESGSAVDDSCDSLARTGSSGCEPEAVEGLLLLAGSKN